MNATATDTCIKTMSPVQVAALQGQGKAGDLIDVRTPMEYGQVHAVGARLAPLDRLDPKAVMATRAGPPDEPIYIICKSGGRAAKACQQFIAAGFANVINVEGGTTAWEQAGLPVLRGKKCMSLERQVRIAAGAMVLLGVILGFLVHQLLFILSGFVGAGLIFAGITDWCGMGMLIAKMPWNQGAACQKCG